MKLSSLNTKAVGLAGILTFVAAAAAFVGSQAFANGLTGIGVTADTVKLIGSYASLVGLAVGFVLGYLGMPTTISPSNGEPKQ